MNDTTAPTPKTSQAARVRPTIANLRWLVSPEITTREIPAKAATGDRPAREARTMYLQLCVVIGGPRALNTELSFFERAECLAGGVYMPTPDAFQLDRQFGRLEFRARSYERLRDMTKEEQEYFEAPVTSLNDLMGG